MVCKVGIILWLLQLFLSERVVIQYVGAPVCPVPASHGNSLTNRPFIRTKPSVLAKIKDAVALTAGHAAPAKMYKEAIRNDNTDDPRACPRNIKQVHVMCIYLVINVHISCYQCKKSVQKLTVQ